MMPSEPHSVFRRHFCPLIRHSLPFRQIRRIDSEQRQRVCDTVRHYVVRRLRLAVHRRNRGNTTPPISVTRFILSKWARFSGVSRTISTSRRLSFKTTSAARVKRLSPKPCATEASVRIEQGATSIPSVLNVPLAMHAPILPIGWTKSAKAYTSSFV